VSEAKSIPVQWTEADYNWKTELPGKGNSSPVLWGNKIFLLSANPNDATRYVICIDSESGKVLWNREYPSTVHHLHTRNTYASSTPAADEDRVYVAWSTPAETTLKAFDHDGREVWSKNLGTWVSQHGFGTSPIVYRDKVIVFVSQQALELNPGEQPGKSYMMAFDRKSGKELWRTESVSTRVCYTAPCIYQPEGGAPELICYSQGDGMFSLDPETGNRNWSVAELFDKRTVNSPVVAGGLIFGSCGSGGGGNYIVGVQPGADAHEVFRLDRQAPYVPTPVAYGDLLFLFGDKGFATCLEAKTGKVHWQERLNTAFSGSPVRVGDKLYCIDESGTVIVLAASKEFKELARNPLGEPSRSTPAVAGGRMFLRTDSHLISIGGKSL
jgi:outer membrane protein assembly factor BamB